MPIEVEIGSIATKKKISGGCQRVSKLVVSRAEKSAAKIDHAENKPAILFMFIILKLV